MYFMIEKDAGKPCGRQKKFELSYTAMQKCSYLCKIENLNTIDRGGTIDDGPEEW
jgi:hypothetical protein